jgi:hypothetical protein
LLARTIPDTVAHKELLPALDTARERVSAREVIGFGGSVRRTQL